MVLGFGILVLAMLFLAAGISGRSLAEVLRGEVGTGFVLANMKIPSIDFAEAAPASGTQPASFGTGGTGVTVPGKRPPGLLEVFYDPLGYYFDSGRIVQGAIGGHGDHVHVAADPGTLRGLAELAKNRFNLTIREYAPYDPVDPVHTSGSFHYSGRAFDASGSAGDMAAFTRYLIGGK